MNQAEIKRKRAESILKELIPEALGALDDSRINSLNVVDVHCSKGRYDAKVYLDPEDLDQNQQQERLRQLQMISNYITRYVKEAEGWYKAPRFTFFFDDQVGRINRIEELFKKIKSQTNGT